ncbi:hypothetical protein K1719_019983 [Acacia pycnantha]|nr:hypothetical protein K1719_019983 [Acacia pycnantha]
MASEGFTTRWSDKNTIIFVTLMVEEVKKGNRTTSTFNKKAWQSMKEDFYKQTGLLYTLPQLRNKMNKLRTEYSSFKKLLSITGFGWNPVLKTATTEDASLWDIHVKSGLPYWEQLVDIFGDVYASGDGGVGNAELRLEKTNVTIILLMRSIAKVNEDPYSMEVAMDVLNDMVGLEDEEYSKAARHVVESQAWRVAFIKALPERRALLINF